MPSQDDIPDSVRGTVEAMKRQPKGYGIVGRIVLFVSAGGLFTAFCAYFFVRFAIGASMTAGASGGPAPLLPILVLWGLGMAALGYLNFKN